MSAASRERQSHQRQMVAHWMEPKRRFYICLAIFLVFCVLQHWNWMFSFGAFGAIALHAGAALFVGNIFCRTISLHSADVIYQRHDPGYAMLLVFHVAILLLFLGTLFLRMVGL